jgi:hypothetical protein
MSCGLELEPEVAFCDGQKRKLNMKKTLTLLTALLLGAALYSASASITITIDENGNGTWDNNGTITSLAFGSEAPIIPNGPVTLYYQLPTGYSFGGGPLGNGLGDLLITEPSTTPTVLSDVIRFDGPSITRIYFYSDNSDGSDSLADRNGLPTTFHPNNVTVEETGLFGAPYSEIMNGYWGYHPGVNQVGSIYNGNVLQDVTYNIISDVPEPTTMIAGALLLLPFGASTIRILRKNRTA